MSTRARMLAMAEDNMEDAADVYAQIEAEQPSRLPVARVMLDDAIRIYSIVESTQRMTLKQRLEVIARLKRADLIAQALQRPVQ